MIAIAAARFGLETTQPLIVAPAQGGKPAGPRLCVEPAGVLVNALKPSDDGKAIIVRLVWRIRQRCRGQARLVQARANRRLAERRQRAGVKALAGIDRSARLGRRDAACGIAVKDRLFVFLPRKLPTHALCQGFADPLQGTPRSLRAAFQRLRYRPRRRPLAVAADDQIPISRLQFLDALRKGLPPRLELRLGPFLGGGGDHRQELIAENLRSAVPLRPQLERLETGNLAGPTDKIRARLVLVKFLPKHKAALLDDFLGIVRVAQQRHGVEEDRSLTSRQERNEIGIRSRLTRLASRRLQGIAIRVHQGRSRRQRHTLGGVSTIHKKRHRKVGCREPIRAHLPH